MMRKESLGSALDIVVGLLINGLAVFITAEILGGVMVSTFGVALVTAVVLGVVNTFLRPVLILLTLPLTFLTLGVFLLVINAGLILLVDLLVEGFEVTNFWWALLFSFVLVLVNTFIEGLQRRI